MNSIEIKTYYSNLNPYELNSNECMSMRIRLYGYIFKLTQILIKLNKFTSIQNKSIYSAINISNKHILYNNI